ncbi:MAG: CBS domain-containing protein [Oxalobacter sp.]|nr:MAG: CBS domain-containing protein [Oxalobacter sp.]
MGGRIMTIGFYCNREVVVTHPETTVLEAAKLMRKHHVGTLIVIEKRDDLTYPIGIITDRDLVLGVMAPELKAEAIFVSDIMNEKLYTVREDESLMETMRIMRGHGIRRIPVVDRQGSLQGIVSLDDLVMLIAEEMAELSQMIVHQKAREIKLRK